MWENFVDHALSMKHGAFLTGWRSAAFALLAGGPAVFLAVVSQDTPVIIFGIATGCFAALWGFLNFGASLMLRTMHQRLLDADRRVDEIRAAYQTLAEEAARTRVLLAEFEQGSSDEVKVIRADRSKLPPTGTEG